MAANKSMDFALTNPQRQVAISLYQAKGDPLELIIFSGLRHRGFDEQSARNAARACSNQIWRNAMLKGAAAAIILATVFTPAVCALAGASMAITVGLQTMMVANACEPVRQDDLMEAVRQIQHDLHNR